MYCPLGTEAYFREQNKWQRAAVGKKMQRIHSVQWLERAIWLHRTLMLTGKDTIGLLPQPPGWRMGTNIQHMHGKHVCLSVCT